MNPREPVRLLEQDSEASAELRELLGAARLDEPSPEQLAALTGKLGALLEAPVEAVPEASAPDAVAGPSAASGGVVGGLKTKVLTGLAVAVLAGGSFQAGRVFERERAAERPVEPVAAAPMPAPTPTPAPEPVPEPARVEVAPPSGTPVPGTKTVPAPRVPRARAPEAPAAVPAGEAAMDEELTLLESAYEALRKGDAAGALAEAERHATRFPAGALAQEREVLAIDALVRLGRRAEAESRAAAFRVRYPTSTHGVRIQGLLSAPGP
jgi:hypothetical protein